MDQGPLTRQLVEAFETMSAQLQAAARYVLDHPRDVALLSMREQARQAGVQPATMTRLAKHLGLDGYDDIRETYAAAVRTGDVGFAGKAGAQVVSQRLKGDKAVAADMLKSLARQIDGLAAPDSLDRIIATAEAISGARRVYCLGLRASHPVAWRLHYVLTLIGDRSIHLDAPGGTGADRLSGASEADLLFAVSIAPYTRLTIELARYAKARGIPIAAVTDSEVSPLAQIADHVALAPTDSPSFFHAVSPAFVIAEVLSAIVAGRGGEDALAAVRRTDEHLAALDSHLLQARARRSS